MKRCGGKIICRCRIAGRERWAFFCQRHLELAQAFAQHFEMSLHVESLELNEKCQVPIGYTAADFARKKVNGKH